MHAIRNSAYVNVMGSAERVFNREISIHVPAEVMGYLKTCSRSKDELLKSTASSKALLKMV